MKQVVDSFQEEQTMAITEAKEIDTSNVPVGTTTHPGERSLVPPHSEVDAPSFLNTKDSVSRKAKAVSKPLIAVVNKIDTNDKNVSSKTPANDRLVIKDNPTTSDIKQVKNEEKSGGEEVKNRNSNTASVGVIANDYKVGLFGGISGLQILVTNSTSENIENAIIEVAFLKPNGAVVKTELVSVQQIAAGGSKTAAVPSSSRGVKVRCRVISSSAKDEIIPTDNM
jgi:hypothetical protein